MLGIESDCVNRMSERIAYGDHEEQIGIGFLFIESDCVSNTNFCGGRRENATTVFSKEPFVLLSGEVSKPRSEQEFERLVNMGGRCNRQCMIRRIL